MLTDANCYIVWISLLASFIKSLQSHKVSLSVLYTPVMTPPSLNWPRMQFDTRCQNRAVKCFVPIKFLLDLTVCCSVFAVNKTVSSRFKTWLQTGELLFWRFCPSCDITVTSLLRRISSSQLIKQFNNPNRKLLSKHPSVYILASCV